MISCFSAKQAQEIQHPSRPKTLLKARENFTPIIWKYPFRKAEACVKGFTAYPMIITIKLITPCCLPVGKRKGCHNSAWNPGLPLKAEHSLSAGTATFLQFDVVKSSLRHKCSLCPVYRSGWVFFFLWFVQCVWIKWQKMSGLLPVPDKVWLALASKE